MSIEIKIFNKRDLELGIAESVEFDKEGNSLGILFLKFSKIRMNQPFIELFNTIAINSTVLIMQNEKLLNCINGVEIYVPKNHFIVNEYSVGIDVLADYNYSDNYVDVTSTNEWFKRIDNLKAFW